VLVSRTSSLAGKTSAVPMQHDRVQTGYARTLTAAWAALMFAPVNGWAQATSVMQSLPSLPSVQAPAPASNQTPSPSSAQPRAGAAAAVPSAAPVATPPAAPAAVAPASVPAIAPAATAAASPAPVAQAVLQPTLQPAPSSAPEPALLRSLKALEAPAVAAGAAGAEPVAPINPVRAAVLRESAQALGVQAGLGEESRRIMALIEQRAQQLDQRFRFNELMMGSGVLPPVISEAQDAYAVDGPVMRVAQRVYRIDEPARFVAVAPTWRSWLYVGLAPDLRPQLAQAQALLPRDDQEKAYWRLTVEEAYFAGIEQARAVFELNQARMERAYLGMRRFFDLHARGMVSKPEVVAAGSVIDREDPNTVVVGSTVFRISRPSDFVEDHLLWRPLGR